MRPHEKRVYDIERVVHFLKQLTEEHVEEGYKRWLTGTRREIYFEPLLMEIMNVMNVCEDTAREYTALALARIGLRKDEIQWYDNTFIKSRLNENQHTL